jgi:hypothetical protein
METRVMPHAVKLYASIFVANVFGRRLNHSGNIARKRALFISASIGIGRKQPHRIIQRGWCLRASA